MTATPTQPSSLPGGFMSAACPQCAATYSIPLAKIGPKGRKLKCASCGHVWVVNHLPPEDSTAPAPAQQPPSLLAPEAQPEPVTEPVPGAAPAAEPEIIPIATPSEEAAPMAAIAPNLSQLAKPAWYHYVAGEQKWLTLALGLVLLGVLGAGASLWQRLQAPAPEFQIPLYQTTETPAKPLVAPPRGVVLHGVQALTEGTPAGVVLTLQGLVANIASTTAPLPALRAELVDDEGKLQDFQPIPLAETTLPPQTELNFAVSFTNPLGTGWRLRWVGR